MEQQNNNNHHTAMVVVAFARIMYTVVLGVLTAWLLSTKGFNSGFWWGLLSIIMILWTVSKAIEIISFITIAVTCKDD